MSNKTVIICPSLHPDTFFFIFTNSLMNSRLWELRNLNIDMNLDFFVFQRAASGQRV